MLFLRYYLPNLNPNWIDGYHFIVDIKHDNNLVTGQEKKKRTAKEIYDSLQKEHPESDDEVSEDSEDQEFGAGRNVVSKIDILYS